MILTVTVIKVADIGWLYSTGRDRVLSIVCIVQMKIDGKHGSAPN